jgi:hypothetical protein
MKSASLRRLAQWSTGAILLLVLQGFCARSAWAGCNHFVRSQTDPMLNASRLDELVAGGPAHGQPAPERRHAQCSGMSCSSQTPLPVSTANPVPERSDQWGALPALAIVRITSPHARIAHEPAPCRSILKASIFHPPRD